MKVNRNPKRSVLGVCLALCALGALLLSSASADTVKIGNLVITIDGQISPKKLPRNEPLHPMKTLVCPSVSPLAPAGAPTIP